MWYQNYILREENKTLKDKLEKTYEFMKQFVIDEMNLLEKFMGHIVMNMPHKKLYVFFIFKFIIVCLHIQFHRIRHGEIKRI